MEEKEEKVEENVRWRFRKGNPLLRVIRVHCLIRPRHFLFRNEDARNLDKRREKNRGRKIAGSKLVSSTANVSFLPLLANKKAL